MNHAGQFLNSSEAARQLGVSAKALRLYEQRGLVVPLRAFRGFLMDHPRAAISLLELLARRLREAEARLAR